MSDHTDTVATIPTAAATATAAIAILTAPPTLGELLPASYRARLERAGAYSERDQRDLAYTRRKSADRLRARLPREREQRAWARAAREAEAAKRRANELYMRRERLYQVRFQAITERVQTEHRIRPAGKSRESHWRYTRQIEAALDGDQEYRALQRRNQRSNERRWARQSRRGMERIAAGVLAVDDRETRRRKVREWRVNKERTDGT